jgi:hypothetical protein
MNARRTTAVTLVAAALVSAAPAAAQARPAPTSAHYRTHNVTVGKSGHRSRWTSAVVHDARTGRDTLLLCSRDRSQVAWYGLAVYGRAHHRLRSGHAWGAFRRCDAGWLPTRRHATRVVFWLNVPGDGAGTVRWSMKVPR